MPEEIAEHLQMEVESIFLDQETFGVVERLYSMARKAIMLLVFSIVVLIVLIGIALVGYIVVPGLFG